MCYNDCKKPVNTYPKSESQNLIFHYAQQLKQNVNIIQVNII